MPLSRETLTNLKASNLSQATIDAARIADSATNPLLSELLAKYGATEGYQIPYPDIHGTFTEKPPYRLRVLQPIDLPKYLQPKASGNHLYVPPIPASLHNGWALDPDQVVFITEGEKKALAGAQAGIPTLAVGGVYSWRTQVYKFPRASVKLEDSGSSKLVSINTADGRLLKENVVPEFLEIDWTGRHVYLVFDSDARDKVQVQQAAVDLSFWLEDQGAVVLQVNLPQIGAQKVGLDDFLITHQASKTFLDAEWLAQFSAPPLPLDIKNYIADLLNEQRINRKLAEKLSRLSLNALNSWGSRYTDESGNYYFFDGGTLTLHEFKLDMPHLRESTFGQLLRNDLGLATNDASVLSRLADDYVIDATTVVPHRVIAAQGDAIYFQISNSRLAKVSSDGIDLVDNGTDDMLFLADEVEPLDEDDLVKALRRKQPVKPRWLNALESVNLEPLDPLDLKQTRELLTCLFYLSPWIYRWRGAMLPLEVCVAEPNSGKTFLYNLRRGVLTGRPGLAGLPDDFKGWASAVGSTGGLWVCDNLGSIRSDYWHRFTDELARLITEPTPTIDLRQLYTTSDIFRVQVQCAFAITTVKNPFTQPDILQRALVYHLNAIAINERDAGWYTRALADRTAWVAESLHALQRFFSLVSKKWDDRYLSGFRLVHFEQAVLLMGEALGFNMRSTLAKLPEVVSGTVAEFDPVVEALQAFSLEWKGETARLRDIVNWADGDEDRRFVNVKSFDNPVLLGKYMKAHKYDIEQATGMSLVTVHNVSTVRLRHEKRG